MCFSMLLKFPLINCIFLFQKKITNNTCQKCSLELVWLESKLLWR